GFDEAADAFGGGAGAAGPEVDGGDADVAGAGGIDGFERDIVPPDGGEGRVLEEELELDGGGVLGGGGVVGDAGPVAVAGGGPGVVGLAGAAAVGPDPIEAGDDLEGFVGEALGAVPGGETVPAAGLDAGHGGGPSAERGGVAVAGYGQGRRP